jgi:tryptophan-rich sensory protein
MILFGIIHRLISSFLLLAMTNFTFSDGVAVWRLVYFTFALVGSLVASWKHGFGKNSGWIYLAIFSIIRIINSSAQLATVSGNNPTAATVAAVTGFLGLSPLLLASLGLISRM